jgi:hypothetical protein
MDDWTVSLGCLAELVARQEPHTVVHDGDPFRQQGIHIDSGAMRVERILPRARGVVPIDISSGVVGVRLRRPPGVAVVADVSPGAVQRVCRRH